MTASDLAGGTRGEVALEELIGYDGDKGVAFLSVTYTEVPEVTDISLNPSTDAKEYRSIQPDRLRVIGLRPGRRRRRR